MRNADAATVVRREYRTHHNGFARAGRAYSQDGFGAPCVLGMNAADKGGLLGVKVQKDSLPNITKC